MNNKIFFDSPEAAQFKTVEGWVSRDGFFYGDNERAARYAGSTHRYCACGNECFKHFVKCEKCAEECARASYQLMPFKEWNGVTPVVIFDTDNYFFSVEEFEDYCDQNEIDPKKVNLCLCVPNVAQEIDPEDYYCNFLPEDTYLDDCAPDLNKKFQELNKFIREGQFILSWTQGRYRTSYAMRGNREEET